MKKPFTFASQLLMLFVIGLFLTAAIFGFLYYSLGIPVVQFSNSTQECVRVLPVGSCDQLPKKYNLEWVR